MIVFNGNAGNRAFRAPLADALARANLAVLLFDYRGFGGNPGSPTEAGLSIDARAARDYVVGRAGRRSQAGSCTSANRSGRQSRPSWRSNIRRRR